MSDIKFIKLGLKVGPDPKDVRCLKKIKYIWEQSPIGSWNSVENVFAELLEVYKADNLKVAEKSYNNELRKIRKEYRKKIDYLYS